jgi:murein DD-endopeptidase MepM/ murein hydrolase activator NlpD
MHRRTLTSGVLAVVVAVLAAVGAGAVWAALGAATVAAPAVRLDNAVQVAPTLPPPTTPYRLPVDPTLGPGWNPTHATYPATDLFLPCGVDVVAPVRGEVLEVRRVDSWDPVVDNPATRGGRSVAILGADGVRYYFAHFQSIEAALSVGQTVEVGQRLGALGDSGRSSACHLHFGISPPCPGKEWSVRRGVVWPYPYLDSWRAGGQRSPADEVAAWATANPDACSEAMADPYAADA